MEKKISVVPTCNVSLSLFSFFILKIASFYLCSVYKCFMTSGFPLFPSLWYKCCPPVPFPASRLPLGVPGPRPELQGEPKGGGGPAVQGNKPPVLKWKEYPAPLHLGCSGIEAGNALCSDSVVQQILHLG